MDRYASVEPRLRMSLQLEEGRRFLLAHPAAALQSYLNELATQMLKPLRPYPKGLMGPLYPHWMVVPAAGVAAFWLCAAGGLALVARREPQLALFLVLAFGLVMIPASNLTFAIGCARPPFATTDGFGASTLRPMTGLRPRSIPISKRDSGTSATSSSRPRRPRRGAARRRLPRKEGPGGRSRRRAA